MLLRRGARRGSGRWWGLAAGGGGAGAGGVGIGAGSCMMTWATRQHEVTDGVVVPGGKVSVCGFRW